MTEEEVSKRREEIMHEMGKLTQEFLNLTDDETKGSNGILTACVISFEGTRFDDEGRQVYRTDHITLPPTSYSASIGILKETLWQIHHNGFSHCQEG